MNTIGNEVGMGSFGGAFRLRWLAYGAIAYYGLRLLRARGMVPNQINPALDAIDRGIDTVRMQLGMGRQGFGSSMGGSGISTGSTKVDSVARRVEDQFTLNR